MNLFDSPPYSTTELVTKHLKSTMQDAVSSTLLPLLSIDSDNVPLVLRSGNRDSIVDNDAASLVVNCSSRFHHSNNSKNVNKSYNKPIIDKDSDLNYLNNYDLRGRCIRHPHVKLRRRRKNLSLKKNRSEDEKWEVLTNVCPHCCIEELIKIASTSKDDEEDDPLEEEIDDLVEVSMRDNDVKHRAIFTRTDTAEETEDSSRSSDGSAATAAARHLPVVVSGPLGKRTILQDDNHHRNNFKSIKRLSHEYGNTNQDIKSRIRKLGPKRRVGWWQ